MRHHLVNPAVHNDLLLRAQRERPGHRVKESLDVGGIGFVVVPTFPQAAAIHLEDNEVLARNVRDLALGDVTHRLSCGRKIGALSRTHWLISMPLQSCRAGAEGLMAAKKSTNVRTLSLSMKSIRWYMVFL